MSSITCSLYQIHYQNVIYEIKPLLRIIWINEKLMKQDCIRDVIISRITTWRQRPFKEMRIHFFLDIAFLVESLLSSFLTFLFLNPLRDTTVPILHNLALVTVDQNLFSFILSPLTLSICLFYMIYGNRRIHICMLFIDR